MATIHVSSLIHFSINNKFKNLFMLIAFFFIMTTLLLFPLQLKSQLFITEFVSMVLHISLIILLISLHVYYTLVRRGIFSVLFPRPQKCEFFSLVDDILYHEEFLKLKTFYHHSDHIYDHVVRVSYLSYVFAKLFRLDFRSAARGGLLHDFFLYDWRNRKIQENNKRLHGVDHPRIALKNAQQYFEINSIEADSIVKHMFPLTIPLPRYKESVIVSLSDKISAVYEYIIPFQLKFKKIVSAII